MTNNIDNGMNDRSMPTHEDGMPISRPNRANICPMMHCQDIRLIPENSRKCWEAGGNDRKSAIMDISAFNKTLARLVNNRGISSPEIDFQILSTDQQLIESSLEKMMF